MRAVGAPTPYTEASIPLDEVMRMFSIAISGRNVSTKFVFLGSLLGAVAQLDRRLPRGHVGMVLDAAGEVRHVKAR